MSSVIPANPVPSPELLLRTIQDALEHLKANDIVAINVRDKSSVTDYMIIASGTSTRHVKSIAEEVQRRMRQIGNPLLGIEGEREGEWVLVDAGDAVAHIMLPRVRDLYMLERLWGDGDDVSSSAQDDAESANY